MPMNSESAGTQQQVMGVLAHPNENSFCAALYREFIAGWEQVGGHSEGGGAHAPHTSASNILHGIDLYRDSFDPLMDYAELNRHIPIDPPATRYIQLLQNCRELVLFFPDWWGAEPAILKGFFDRLLRQGIAYDREDIGGGKSAHTQGLLPQCGLSLWICSDSTGKSLSATRACYEQRFRFIANYCAFRQLELHFCSPLRGSSLRKRREWLQACREQSHRLRSSSPHDAQ